MNAALRALLAFGLVPVALARAADDGVALEDSDAPPFVAAPITAELAPPAPEAPTEVDPAEAAVPAGPPPGMGRITGVVSDWADGAPLSGARIVAIDLGTEVQADETGAFAFDLPPGTWDLAVVHDGFGTESLGVVVQEGVASDHPVSLLHSDTTAMVVQAEHVEGGTAELLEERQEAAVVSDVVGAEEMSKSGDSDAAGALERVTGLTLVGGRYIYVRGLGERYSATLFDGAGLPSPEPERRVVPLDLIPAGVLDSVVINKTFTPDMPAEFGGGTIRLRTRKVPYEQVMEIGLDTGGTTRATFQPGLHADAGPTDFLGIDAGHRALPGPIADASEKGLIKEGDQFSSNGYTARELEKFGEMMSNRWALDEAVLPPDFGASITIGNGIDTGGWDLGALASLSFGSKWDTDRYTRTYYVLGENDELEPGHVYDFDETVHETNLGGLLRLGAELPGQHGLDLTVMVTRDTDAGARIYEGYNRDVDGTIQVGRGRWEERMLVTNQVAGHHVLPGHLKAEWRYTFSWASRLEPDRREYRYDYENSTDLWYLSDRPEGNQMFWSDLRDRHHDGGLDLTIPFAAFGRAATDADAPNVKVGGGVIVRDRTVDTRRFKYFHKGPVSREDEVLTRPIEDVFVPETIGPDGFQMEEFTRETDNYTASQRIYAGYAMADLPLGAGPRVVGGVRVEKSDQDVATYALFDPSATPIESDLATLDFLPALVLTQRLNDTMQVRGAYGRTVSRPDFRELSPATFNDVTGGRLVYGNPNLERAIIDSADVRWEWFPDRGEVVSLGAFYKAFQDPIETIVVVSAQHSVTWANADGAHSLGVEAEVEKRLDFAPALEHVTVGLNGAWIYSRVVLGDNDGIQTSDERPLQGQSPWVINASVAWEQPYWGLTATALYHAFGPRIVEVGALGAPDTIELPVHEVDVVVAVDLGAGFELGAKAQNLLDWPIRFRMGDEIVESWRDGIGFSVGVSWKGR